MQGDLHVPYVSAAADAYGLLVGVLSHSTFEIAEPIAGHADGWLYGAVWLVS